MNNPHQPGHQPGHQPANRPGTAPAVRFGDRAFGCLAAVLLTLVNTPPFWGAAALVLAVALLRPRTLAPVAGPVWQMAGQVALWLVFYGIVTPIAVVRRARWGASRGARGGQGGARGEGAGGGRMPLRPIAAETSYWIAHPPSDGDEAFRHPF